MTVGTKSLLFGVHQFLWHPFTVALAFRHLYRRWPSWRETVGIVVHDWGYWGKPNMDGEEGRGHPLLGAWLAGAIVGWIERKIIYLYPGTAEHYYDWTLCHSREYARLHGLTPSALCWADKYCVWHDPKWFYLLRGHLSGEIHEFRANATPHSSASEWFVWYRNRVSLLPEIQRLLRKK